MHQRRQDRHVVRLKHIKARGEHIGQLPFMHEHGRLTFAHSQLCTIFNLVGFAFKAPNHGVAGVIGPFDNVDKLSGQKI